MGQNNSRRISHDVDTQQNVFRDDQLRQILDDLGEEDTGKGFSETIYSGVFISQIITWDGPLKDKKRSQIDFTYQVGTPFIETIVKTIYDEETGTTPVSTITATITYNANKTVNTADVVTARL